MDGMCYRGRLLGPRDVPMQRKHPLDRVRTEWLDKPSPRVKTVPGRGVVEERAVLARSRYVEVKITPNVSAELRRAELRHEAKVDHVVDVTRRDRRCPKALNVLEEHLKLAGFGYKVIPISLRPRELEIDRNFMMRLTRHRIRGVVHAGDLVVE